MTRLAAFEPLGTAERAVLASLGDGTFVRLGDGEIPEGPDDARTVRAAFLRVLLLGGEDVPFVHEKGVRLAGAFVEGTLDLEGCRIARSLGLFDCRLERTLVLRAAVIDALHLDGSALPGLLAERIEARGDVSLGSTAVDGAVRLGNGRIGGSLVVDAAVLDSGLDVALDASGVETRGGFFLRGARVRGGISLANATVGSDLEAIGLEITRADAVAFDASGITVAGNLALRRASVEGEAILDGAHIGGDLDLSGAHLSAPGGAAFGLARATVDGAFILRESATVNGLLQLNGTTVGLLVDAPASWPGPGDLSLNGFLYGGFLASPVDAATRLRWLALQDPTRSGDGFWPQPYETLAGVLARMGHHEDASAVLFEKERLQRRARRARASPLLRTALTVRDAVLLVTVGFGLRPHLAVIWLAALWFVGALLMAAAENRDAIRPNVALVLRSPEWLQCGRSVGETVHLVSLGDTREGLAAPDQSQLACWRALPEAGSFPKFNAWMFAGDAMLPALQTGQRDYWSADTRQPFGVLVKSIIHLITVAGWALSLLAVAAFSGLVRSR
ncbi:hypothetical protein [Acuticoccus sediminis]|uniref:hypothetical protein n=1 Tax=Acuticoccus sediminis TaxID=2184697 RepID=UPI00192E640E|nr:hypothetical protein [Acuticoccus sediminis]